MWNFIARTDRQFLALTEYHCHCYHLPLHPPRLHLLSALLRPAYAPCCYTQLLCQNASVLMCAPFSCQQWNKAERCPALIEQCVTVHTLGFVIFAAKPIAHLWKANLPCVNYLHTHHEYCDCMMTWAGLSVYNCYRIKKLMWVLGLEVDAVSCSYRCQKCRWNTGWHSMCMHKCWSEMCI